MTKTTCVPGTIEDCVNELQLANKKDLCITCNNGKYSFIMGTKTGCFGLPEGSAGIKNCLWGGFYRAGKFGCDRCEPGYSLNVDFDHPDSCTLAEVEGCLFVSGVTKKCAACDVYDGWSMQVDGSCVKAAES